MKKFLLAIIAVVAFGLTKVNAQDYTWAVGVRLGIETSGLSVKYNFNPRNSIDGLISIRYDNGFNVNALYEWNIPVIQNGFNFYYGAGVGLGTWKHDHNDKFTLGVTGVVGLEYKFPRIPLAVSVDYRPALNFVGHTGFEAADFGLGIKVAF